MKLRVSSIALIAAAFAAIAQESGVVVLARDPRPPPIGGSVEHSIQQLIAAKYNAVSAEYNMAVAKELRRKAKREPEDSESLKECMKVQPRT